MASTESPGHPRPSTASGEPGEAVRIWDLPTRLTHWLLALLIAAAWYTGGDINRLDWHRYIGYAILGLVVFRLGWGVIGTRNARFREFLRGPRAVFAYSRTLVARRATPYATHNPLGGWAALLMLGLLLLQAVTGLFTHEDIFFTHGPWYPAIDSELARTLSRIHRTNIDVLLVVIAIHLAAVAFHRIWKRENLVTPMLSGYKRLPARLRDSGISGSRPGRALVLALIVAALVWALVALAPEPAAPDYYF